MRALLQRVTEASVAVVEDAGDAETVGAIGPGLVVLVCAEPGDTEDTVAYFARKVAAMRIFEDAEGKVNLSVRDVGGSALVVSQFTLAADTARGNRPGFSGACPPARARGLFDDFIAALTARHEAVATGRFGADMQVGLINDGPVTFWLTS